MIYSNANVRYSQSGSLATVSTESVRERAASYIAAKKKLWINIAVSKCPNPPSPSSPNFIFVSVSVCFSLSLSLSHTHTHHRRFDPFERNKDAYIFVKRKCHSFILYGYTAKVREINVLGFNRFPTKSEFDTRLFNCQGRGGMHKSILMRLR